MLAWLGQSDLGERRTMLACWGGSTLDGFDQRLYSFVVPTIIAVWGVSTGAAGDWHVHRLTSSFGGWFPGALADRFGRLRVLQIRDPVVFGLHFLVQLCAEFRAAVVLARLAWAGFGGESATGVVLMGEVIRDESRGRGVGFVQTRAAVGPGLAALIYASPCPSARNDRVAPFFRSASCPPCFCYGSPAASGMEASRGGATAACDPGSPACSRRFAGRCLSLTIKVSLMVMGAQGGVWAVGFWMPTYLRTMRHLSATGTGLYVAV